MPSYIIKPFRDRDWYCYWSEVVEAPLCWGTRTEMFAYLTRQSPSRENTPERVEDRLMRTDKTGTSVLWGPVPRVYSYDDSDRTLVYMQQGYFSVDKLPEFCERIAANDLDPDVSDMLTPFENDPDDDPDDD